MLGLLGSEHAQRLAELIGELIKVGVVSSLSGTYARVVFPDRGQLVSYDLPVLQHGARRTQGHWMPEVEEQVLCVFLPNGVETGFVLGSFYSNAQPAPDVPAGAVVVAGDSVRLGDADADDPVVRKSDLQAAIDDTVSRINDLVTDLLTHTHSGVMTGPGATGAPVLPLTPPNPVQAAGSDKVFSS